MGTRMAELLTEKGYSVSLLSRSRKKKINGYRAYYWDVDEGEIEDEAIVAADHIIHLAGANIAGKRWTPERKKELYNSRILSALLIHKKLEEVQNKVQTFISANAVGYYGDSGDAWKKENDPAGNDFLANLCKDWQEQALKIGNLGIRTVVFRNGIVLTDEGGALPEMTKTQSVGVLGYLGDGRQFYSWIHLDDICRMYIHAIERKELSGPFNAVSPDPVRHQELMAAVKDATDSNAILMPVPGFALRIGVGEVADSLLASVRCSSEKIEGTGFEYLYPDLDEALEAIYE